jgi:hypothetical protein
MSSKLIAMLNVLGPQYHGWFGITPENYFSGIPDGCEQMVNEAVANGDATIDHDEEGEGVTITYDEKYLEGLSKKRIMYKTVIIKFSENSWNGVPDEWYNQESNKWWKKTKSKLLPLNTRKYIKIVEPFMEVSISSVIKGSLITIDDILFASRDLMADATRTIDEGYKVLSSDKNAVLILEPCIDNFST